MAETICGIVRAGYLPASFNGVPFDAVDVGSEHGRRGAEGEFPFGEFTAYADLGRRIRTYTLSGKIQRDGFLGISTALIAACELPGPGILVHPTRGIISAACKSCRVSDKLDDERGVTYFDLEFVEGNAWPNGLSLVGAFLGLAFGAIINASRDSFRTRYRPRRTPVARRPQVITSARRSINLIRVEYQKSIVGTTDAHKYRALSDLELVESDEALLVDVETTERALALGLNAIALEQTGKTKFDTMRRLANKHALVSTIPDATGAESEDAIFTIVRVIAAAYMAQAANETTYGRTGEVYNAIDAIDAILSEEGVAASLRCENGYFDEIQKFSVDTKKALYDRAYRLPALVSYNFNGGVHPLVAAYSIFNDAKRHRELETSNIMNSTGRIGPSVVGSSL